MKAQVTLWMIIGIIIFAAVAISIPIVIKVVYSDQYPEVKDHVDECLNQVAYEGLKKLSLSGGTLTPDNPIDAGFAQVSMGPIDKQRFIDEYEEYIENNIKDCLDFNNYDYQVTTKEPEAIVTLAAEKTLVKLNMVTKAESKTFRTFYTEFDIRTDYLIDTMNHILSDKHYNLDYMHTTGLNISIFTFELDSQVVVIHEPLLHLAAGSSLY